MRHCMALTVVAVLLAAVVLALPAFAAPDWTTRAGTIVNAVSQPDGTRVYLDAVIVDKIKARQNPAYFVVHEVWDARSRIVVCIAPPEELRLGQTVDIDGTLGTLPNGQRSITSPRVVGYMDAALKLKVRGGIMKALFGVTPWEHKADMVPGTQPGGTPVAGEPNSDPLPEPAFAPSISNLLAPSPADIGSVVKLDCKKILSKGTDPYGTFLNLGEDDSAASIKLYVPGEQGGNVQTAALSTAAAENGRLNDATAQVQTLDTGDSVLTGPGTPGDPQQGGGTVSVAIPGTVAYARTIADGDTVTISHELVTAADEITGIYVQELDRSAGIRVVYSGSQPLKPGATVNITGMLGTTPGGERQIVAGSAGITVVSPAGDVPGPIGMTNGTLGGSAYNSYTPGISYPTAAAGLYNKGSFVKIWGLVTAVDPTAHCFYVDDGSAVNNGPDRPLGVKAVWSAEGEVTTLPNVGDYLTNVIGISGSEARDGGTYSRVLRIRKIGAPAVQASALSKLVDLSWTAQDHTEYAIYRSADQAGPFQLITKTRAGSYRDTGLTNGTTYYYQVTGKTSEIEGPASATVSATPTGSDPTIDSTFDAATYTYTYTVTCPANNERAFIMLQVYGMVQNATPTSPWSGSGPTVGIMDLAWPFATATWDSETGNTAAIWSAYENGAIPANNSIVAQFKLVVPGSEPTTGNAFVVGAGPGGRTAHEVLVPGPKAIIAPSYPPVTTINLSGTLGNNGWYVSPVTVELTATDPDYDYDKSYFKLDDMNAAWQEYSATFNASSDGPHQVAAYSVDVAGNTEDPAVTAEFKIDATAPVMTAQAATQPNGNGWYNADVPINYTASDAVSGLASPQAAAPGATVQFSQTVAAEGLQSDTGSATDQAGNTASKTVQVQIDKTAPVMTVNTTTQPNDSGWYNADVQISYTAVDMLSGLASPEAAAPGALIQFTHDVTSEGDASDSATAMDKAGNTTSQSIDLKVDKTPPVVTAEPVTQPNAAGWYSADVYIDYTATDALSGLASPEEADPGVSVEFSQAVTTEGQVSDTGTATDVAGNVGTKSVDVKLDKTPPVVTGQATTNPNSNGWYKTDVQVNFTATDSVSGLATPQAAQPGASINFSQTVTLEGQTPCTGTAVDLAGNPGSKTVNLKIDKTPPTLTLTKAPCGNNHVINFDTCVIEFTATDLISGLDGNPQVIVAITPTAGSGCHTGSGCHWGSEGGPFWGWSRRSHYMRDWMRRNDEHPVNRCGWDPYVISWMQDWIDHGYNDDRCDDAWGAAVVNWIRDRVDNDDSGTGAWDETTITTYDAVSIGGDKYQVTFPYEIPGIYSMKLTAKDNAGNTAQSTVPITFSAGGFTVEWLEPLCTMDTYVMEDGSTLPIKFRLRDPANIDNYVDNCLYTVKVIDDNDLVWKQVKIPDVDMLLGLYRVNIKTKDANNVDWPAGNYTVVIEGPGIWDTMAGPFKSRYGVEIVAPAVCKGRGRK